MLLDTKQNERRVALTPIYIAGLVKKGHTIYVTSGAGDILGYPDGEYENSGAIITDKNETTIINSDIIICLSVLSFDDIRLLNKDKTVIGMMDIAHRPETSFMIAKSKCKMYSLDHFVSGGIPLVYSQCADIFSSIIIERTQSSLINLNHYHCSGFLGRTRVVAPKVAILGYNSFTTPIISQLKEKGIEPTIYELDNIIHNIPYSVTAKSFKEINYNVGLGVDIVYVSPSYNKALNVSKLSKLDEKIIFIDLEPDTNENNDNQLSLINSLNENMEYLNLNYRRVSNWLNKVSTILISEQFHRIVSSILRGQGSNGLVFSDSNNIKNIPLKEPTEYVSDDPIMDIYEHDDNNDDNSAFIHYELWDSSGDGGSEHHY